MKNIKKPLYTLTLIAAFLVVSPFIIHNIWKSSDSKKPVKLPSVADTSVSEQVGEADDGNDEAENVPENEITENPPDSIPDDSLFSTSDVSYFSDALFIGDSRTVGIKEYGTFRDADFFCSVGLSASRIDDETIDDFSFENKIDSRQYGKVYIMLGINEVGNDFEYTLTNYRAIVEKIKVHQPDALIYLQGNLHVSYSAENDVINNYAIDALNEKIATLADNKKVFYIDINEVYDDSNGYLTEEYTSDGVHPLAKYYTQWCDWLCTKTVVRETEAETAPETIPEQVEEPETESEE